MLDKAKLKWVIDKFTEPGVDVAGDGVFDVEWRSTETFYRHTEEYVVPEKRAAYKLELELAFPGRKAVV